MSAENLVFYFHVVSWLTQNNFGFRFHGKEVKATRETNKHLHAYTQQSALDVNDLHST